jgi:hypothetical protein
VAGQHHAPVFLPPRERPSTHWLTRNQGQFKSINYFNYLYRSQAGVFSVVITLRAGLSRQNPGRISKMSRPALVPHPPSHSAGTKSSFPPSVKPQGMKLTIHLHPVPWLRINGVVPLHPRICPHSWPGTTSTLHVHLPVPITGIRECQLAGYTVQRHPS